MKLDLVFELNNSILPIDYKSVLLSFIKRSVQDFSPDWYESLYGKDSTKLKSFTFAPLLEHPKFNSDFIQIQGKRLKVSFRIYGLQDYVKYYNAFLAQKGKAFPMYQNQLKLLHIYRKNPISFSEHEYVIRFLSPLIVRKHDKEMNQSQYYNFNDDDFLEVLKMNIQNTMDALGVYFSLDGFDLIPIKAKKTVVKLFHTCMNANIGIFKLTGDPKLIEFLYLAGMGSKRSTGHGCFERIG